MSELEDLRAEVEELTRDLNNAGLMWRQALERAEVAEARLAATGLNAAALEELVRHAMASGAVCFMDKVRAGQVDPSAPLMDAFGDFPGDFLKTRTDLLEGLVVKS